MTSLNKYNPIMISDQLHHLHDVDDLSPHLHLLITSMACNQCNKARTIPLFQHI